MKSERIRILRDQMERYTTARVEAAMAAARTEAARRAEAATGAEQGERETEERDQTSLHGWTLLSRV